MKKLVYLSIILCLASLFAIYLAVYFRHSIYFGLVSGKNGDKLEIFANDRLIHQESLKFNNGFGAFSISEDNRYVMSRYHYVDSLLKVKIILNNAFDTTFYVDVKKIKGCNINIIKGKVDILYDYQEGGLEYLFREE